MELHQLMEQGEVVTSPTPEPEWVHFTDDGAVMTCAMPASEAVIEVLLFDGSVRRAFYESNISEPGDWDIIPVTAEDEPDFDEDSLVGLAIAWRSAS